MIAVLFYIEKCAVRAMDRSRTDLQTSTEEDRIDEDE